MFGRLGAAFFALKPGFFGPGNEGVSPLQLAHEMATQEFAAAPRHGSNHKQEHGTHPRMNTKGYR